jgi:Carbohydrate-selective porin, OprB family
MRSGDWRHGVLAAAVASVAPSLANGVELSGGLTAIGLFPSSAPIADDRTLSVDLNLVQRYEHGQLFAYLEGNSSLDERRASTVLVESNADAGTALDPDRRGRVQLSELNYQLHRPAGRELTFGLLDASGYLDRTRITNDENVQFLGASFVNNPTIEFPDYTLGVVYQSPAVGRRPQINAVLTSSNGLADNPNLSYSQLFQVADAGKGVFAAAGLGWPKETRLTRVGAWINTREHDDVNGLPGGGRNYGMYAVFGQSWRAHAMNLRVGLANEDVTRGSAFVALAYRYRLREHAIGAGIAHTFLSPAVVERLLDDSTHVEIFARLAIAPTMHLSVSAQWLHNSGFHAAPSDPRHSVAVAGIRFHYAF